MRLIGRTRLKAMFSGAQDHVSQNGEKLPALKFNFLLYENKSDSLSTVV